MDKSDSNLKKENSAIRNLVGEWSLSSLTLFNAIARPISFTRDIETFLTYSYRRK